MAQQSPVAGELPRGILAFPGVSVSRAPEVVFRRDALGEGSDDDEGWHELCERLLDRWPQLTPGELEATHGQPALVEALLDAKLRYARRLLDEAFQPWRLRATRPRRGSRGLLGVLGLISVSGLTFFGLLLP